MADSKLSALSAITTPAATDVLFIVGASPGRKITVANLLRSGSTDNALIRADGTGGGLLQGSVATLDDSGNLSTAGSASFGVGGSVAGTLELTQGTAPSLGTTSVKIYAPASVTSYAFKLPAASVTGVLLGTDATNVNTLSFVAPGTSGNVLTSNGTTWASSAPNLVLAASPGSDDTYQGASISGLNAGATIAQWDAVYLGSSSKWLIADANGAGTYPAVGLATTSGTDTNPLVVVVGPAVVRNDAWNWTPGGIIYLSESAGGLTQTAPTTSGSIVQQIGVALTADVLFLNGNSVYITLV